MALPVMIAFTPEDARETLATLEHMRDSGKVPNDVHALIRRLRKAISDAGYGPTTAGLSDDDPDTGER